jgi:acyl-CoA thioesterase-2
VLPRTGVGSLPGPGSGPARHDERVTADLDQLLETLDLEPIEVDIYRGVSPKDSHLRVFGGQVAGQALVAAGRTVGEGRPVHSLHAYFLRPGDPTTPIVYQVDRIRDGRSFTTRRVAAIQNGEAIFHLSASFHVPEEGVSHQVPMPDVPDPETLPTWRERMAPYAREMGPWYDRPRPIDVRYIGEPVRTVPTSEVRSPSHQVWLRADGKLADDPLLHACIVAYASDMTLLDTVMLPHGLIWEGNGLQVSLDHAMWFHRPLRADDWLLYRQSSPTAAGSRGLATGTIFTRDGDLVVSVVQEGLLRTTTSSRAHT